MNFSIIETAKKNKYIYSENTKNFLWVPPQMENYLKGISPKNTNDYYWKKYQFWKKHLLKEKEPINLITSYPPDTVSSNLANLRQLVIEVTDTCNLKCKYCGFGELYFNYDSRTSKKLSFDKIKILLDYLSKLWKSPKNISYNTITIGFYGGEPLLNFKLIQKTICYIENLSIPGIRFTFNMTTNAMLLNKYINFIVEKQFILLISLDGNKYNDSYRITHKGKNSFEQVIANVELLKNTYPEYFEKHVNFNAVLHDRNSVDDIYNFIKEKFDKEPRIAELSMNNIRKDKKKEFQKMFTTTEMSLKKSINYQVLKERYDILNTEILVYKNFIDAFCGNAFDHIAELINPEKREFIPTGTCSPFKRKIYLSVNGKIFPCEKIGHAFPLGQVTDNSVEITSTKITELYDNFYKKIISYCKNCISWKNCGQCVYYLEEKNGKIFCPGFFSNTQAHIYYTRFIDFTETWPYIYEKASKQITID